MYRRTFIKKSLTVTVAACGCGMGLASSSAFSGISNVPEAPDDSFKLRSDRLVISLDMIPSLDVPGGNVKISIAQGMDEPLKILIARKGMAVSCPYRTAVPKGSGSWNTSMTRM